jgi:MoxR-like ATPase
MQEHRVTTGGNTYELDQPFFVLATQNPIEQEGTYPLPEAQLDRFMFNILIDYPSKDEEIKIVKMLTTKERATLDKVISKDELQSYQELIKHVPVADNVIEYAVQLVSMTRPSDESSPQITRDWLDWGAGPRASTFLIMAAQAKCLLTGKSTPDIDDIKDIAKPVLRHRIITNFTAEADGISKEDVLDQLIAQIKI